MEKRWDSAIKVNNVVKKFDEFTAVKNLSFSVPKNKIFGLLGSNGAGKTTTMNMLTGLLLPDNGSIEVLGMDASSNIEEIRKRIALVPQTMSLYDSLTVYENMEFFGGLYLRDRNELKKRISNVLEALKIADKKHVRISKLSGGYQRRCSIACALLSNPEIFFLDEPLAGIDLSTHEMIMKFLKSMEGITIIMTTHSIKEAEAICDHVLFMDKGEKILEGEPEQIVKLYAESFGERVLVEFDEEINVSQVRAYLELAGFKLKDLKAEGNKISFVSENLGNTIINVLDSLRPLELHVLNIDIKKPTLEDIFLYVMESRNEGNESNKEGV